MKRCARETLARTTDWRLDVRILPVLDPESIAGPSEQSITPAYPRERAT